MNILLLFESTAIKVSPNFTYIVKNYFIFIPILTYLYQLAFPGWRSFSGYKI